MLDTFGDTAGVLHCMHNGCGACGDVAAGEDAFARRHAVGLVAGNHISLVVDVDAVVVDTIRLAGDEPTAKITFSAGRGIHGGVGDHNTVDLAFFVGKNFFHRSFPAEFHSFFDGVVIFGHEGAHVLDGAVVEDSHLGGVETQGCAGGVDGGVAATDYKHTVALTDRHLVAGDEA